MSKIKILIVEDDMIIAADISMHLTKIGYEVQGILARGEDAIKTVQENPPDFLLMDVNLRGAMDGIEVVQQIRAINDKIGIIYLTANADEVTYNRAKVTKPEAFIAKPFKRLDLSRAIELAMLRLSETNALTHPNTDVVEAEDSSFILDDRIFVKYRDRMVKVYVQDILYAEADRNYCKVFTSDREYLMTLSLKAFEQKLNAENFLRIHRSYIINLTKVDGLSDHGEYVNIGKQHLSVSRSFKEELMRRLKVI
ncbi:MAG: LytTR family transcriptional regulator DNA-binding domain-containing protein [Bacteroidota bacterium]